VRTVASRRSRRAPHAPASGEKSHDGQSHQHFVGQGKTGGNFQGHGFLLLHLLRQEPYKLVLVRTGNIGIRELKELFARNLPLIEKALKKHSLVELDRSEVRVIV
jgi:hypothetical protein